MAKEKIVLAYSGGLDTSAKQRDLQGRRSLFCFRNHPHICGFSTEEEI